MLNIFNTSFEVAESNIDTAVMPMGSLEPKGPHLPVGLDMMLAERFARDFGAGRAVYVLPTFPFSTAVEARGFRGTVAASQQTLWDVIEDVARFLSRHRFRRLVVVDWSNHNWILKHCAREINMDLGLLQTVWVNPRQFAREAAEKSLLPDYGGGAIDTSLAMALFPETVREPRRDFDAGVPREYVDYAGLAKVAPEGYWGRPSLATKEAGASLYRLMLEQSREFVDYALGMGGSAPIGVCEGEEIWWPEGEIHGLRGGLSWHSSNAEIEASKADIAIITTSATEQHSTCQPLGTDYFQALELSRGVARELGAYLLPALPYITSWGHARFRGTVTLRAMTVRRILEDAVESLYEAGWRKVAIINVHGGNWVVKPTLIEAARRYPDMSIVATGDILAYRGQAPVEELHANAGEGSFIKAFYPQAFKSARLVDFSPQCTASAFDFVGIGGVSPLGVWGYPSKSDAEAGRKAMAAQIAQAAGYIRGTLEDLEGRYGARV